MSDGWVEANSNKDKARVRIESSNLEYLEWIKQELSNYLFSSLSKKSSKGDEKEYNGVTIRNNSDTHQLDTIYHPELLDYHKWYTVDGKCWPKNLKLTPLVLKNLYCGDGSWNNVGSNNHIQIAMSNEREEVEKVRAMFERVGLSISNFNIQERSNSFVCDAQPTKSESEKMWEYMGEPLPGFEYKWPDQYI